MGAKSEIFKEGVESGKEDGFTSDLRSTRAGAFQHKGFNGHVATGGSGKWGARGWSVEQLDYDEELALLRGWSMEAEVEVQRTIQRVELTAFFCLLKMVIGP